MTFAAKHILVLEDEPIIAFGLEDLLIQEGASVVVAGSLEQARAAVAETHFDFAILDVNVQGDKSYPFAKELRERDVPFVFATGYGDAEHPVDLANMPTITKPYSIDQIRQAAANADRNEKI
jgi:DNA-binding response OmpR family regulator